MILSTHGVLASQIASFDADAVAFFNRVTTAGGSLSNTEKVAVNQLVLDMKSYGIWSAMKAIYPMVGASAAACSRNLKSDTFNGTFTASGWTFASTGVTPNGTSAYMDTNFNTNTNQTVNNFSLSVYLRTATQGSGSQCDIGNATLPTYLPLTHVESVSTTSRSHYCWDYNTAVVSFNTSGDSRGMWGISRSGATSWQSFERNTAVAQTTTTNQTTLPNLNVGIGASIMSTGASTFSPRQVAFAHLGNALSNTEFNNFYTAVQAFQTTLSRQV